MNSIVIDMLNKYNCKSKEDYLNAFKEVVQEIALYSLSQTDFFEHAAFYGGTALRIFYRLDRFSEDLDFSLCKKCESFDLSIYFDALKDTFNRFGLNFNFEIKRKTKESNIQSAFLKGNTLEHILLINPNNNISEHIQSNEIIKIKLEIDINPPAGATFEYKYGNFPAPYKVKIYDEASLFAGKIHAILCRSWEKRTKGRDLYDFLFYINNNCVLNIGHLKQRMIESGHLNKNEELNLNNLKDKLQNKIKEINLNNAKNDVLPFINNSSNLNLWEKNFFIHMINKLQINEIKVQKVQYDISEYGIAREINKDILMVKQYPSIKIIKNIIENIRKKLAKYIYEDDDILNYGNKTNLKPKYYIIKVLNERIIIDININEVEIINLLNI